MEIIGWLGVVIGFIVPIAQLVRMLKTKRTKDISIITYITLVTGIGLKFVYSLEVNDLVFIVSYGGGLVLNAIVLVYMIVDRVDYNRRKRHGRKM